MNHVCEPNYEPTFNVGLNLLLVVNVQRSNDLGFPGGKLSTRFPISTTYGSVVQILCFNVTGMNIYVYITRTVICSIYSISTKKQHKDDINNANSLHMMKKYEVRDFNKKRYYIGNLSYAFCRFSIYSGHFRMNASCCVIWNR